MEKIAKKYEFAVIATDVVIFSIIENKLQTLLIKMKKDPFKDCWAASGGLVRGDESVDEAAKRILQEKTGVANIYLEQLYTFGQVDRDPFGRVVSVAYFALIPNNNTKIQTTEEYADISWFSISNLPKLAYDHKEIIATAIKRLQAKLEYTNIAYSLLPEEFTLTELQSVYEIILNRPLDKRNFRKKVIALKLVKSTGKKALGLANRPAILYSFSLRTPQIIEII